MVPPPEDSTPQEFLKAIHELMAELKLLREELAATRAEREAVMAERDELRQRLEELEKKPPRSASPFSKNAPKKDPKKPGRKPGEGNFRNRTEPELTEPPVRVPVADKQCGCGGKLLPDGTERVTYTRLPKREPVVVGYDVEICRCKKCGKRLRASHPDLPADQTGATAHRVHPEVFAMAHTLHYGLGMPVRKVAVAMKTAFGVTLTQDSLKRAAGDLASVYEQLVDQIRRSPVVYTDDTGWRVKGLTAFLMGFDSDLATVFQIRSEHRHQQVLEVLGEKFAGKLVTDRGKSYDAKAMLKIPQNKCASHLLKNISELCESQCPQAQTVGLEIAELIRESLGLWRGYHKGEIARDEFDRAGSEIHEKLGRALRPRRLRDPGNRRLVKELRKHYGRGNLLRHLKSPEMEPTNNRAERALRPAVIGRKVSHCSKTDEGAKATSTFKSIIETAKKRGLDAYEAMLAVCTGTNPLAPAAD